MNYKRALAFALLLYVITFVIFGAIQYFYQSMSLTACIIFWLLNIPVVLMLSKWFFKMDAPTAKKGFLLGVLAVLVGVTLDIVLFGASAIAQGLSISEMLKTMYTDWKMYVALGEVILLTTLAGTEFDATYTKRA